MEISNNICRPWLTMTGLISHQLHFMEHLFRLSTQGLRITMFELMPMVIVGLHNTQNDVGNQTAVDFLYSVNKNKAALSLYSSASSKQLTKIREYFGNDNIKINDCELSVGTIIRREAMKKLLDYSTLTPEDLALVDCGMNNILDITKGTLTNQNALFSKNDWNYLKTLLESPAASTSVETNNQNNSCATATLRKLSNIFKDLQDPEECYWSAKVYQRKATKKTEKIGYELLSVLLDKLIKHPNIFLLSKPTPSEADVMIKVWADLFEVLFYNTNIYIRWGEKGLPVGNNDNTIFKLDAKLVLLYDEEEYPVSWLEFAPYAGPKKIKTDRAKLLVESKIIYNSIMDLNVTEVVDSLCVVSSQIMGLEINKVSIKSVSKELYVGHTIGSLILPSTAPTLKKEAVKITDFLFDYKNTVINTANTIKTTLSDKKKHEKKAERGRCFVERANGQL